MPSMFSKMSRISKFVKMHGEKKLKNRLFIIITVAGTLVLAIACMKKDRYADARGVLEKIIGRLEAFTLRMEKAEEAKAAAAAIQALVGELRGEAQALKALGTRFPELSNPLQIPESLKPFLERLEKADARMVAAMQKAMSWGFEPEVKAARDLLAEVEAALR